MRYLDIINEGRDAPLYHGTGIGAAILILQSNKIIARTEQDSRFLAGYGLKSVKLPQGFDDSPVQGVSLSRSKAFAETFGEIVFELDQRKLAQTNKIVPYDFWSAAAPKNDPSQRSQRGYGIRKYEYEEFCVGPIDPLSRYLIAIYMTQKKHDFVTRYGTEDEVHLLANPLLKINGYRRDQ